MKQSDYWDTVLDPQNLSEGITKDFDISLEQSFYQTSAQEYAYQKMGDLQGKMVLEIGCGMGVNSILLNQKGAKVTAIDISQKRLAWVKQLLKDNPSPPTFLRASGEILPFHDNSFDIVYSNAVLIHLDKLKTTREVFRVLKPGGMAIFIEPLKYHPLVNLYRYTLGPKVWRKIASYFSFKDIEQMGQCFNHYEHKEFYLFSFFSFYWEFGHRNLSKFKKSLFRWQKIDNFLFKLCPFLNRLSWFTVFCGYKK
jgi:ubiquinone/menaquinone biosynthesis C-methylase UbiE